MTKTQQPAKLSAAPSVTNSMRGTAKFSDFPLGSAESRALARMECNLRASSDDENALVVLMNRLPQLFRPVVVNAPDSLSYYEMPDRSIVEVVRRYNDADCEYRSTIFLYQGWPDGSPYYGEFEVTSLANLQTRGRLTDARPEYANL